MKKFVILMLALAILPSAYSQKKQVRYAKVEKDMYPKAESGYKQVSILLPITNGENRLKVEIVVGKTMMLDCNNYFMTGDLNEKLLEGWGYTYFVAKTDGHIGGTKMACPDEKTTKQFVHIQSKMVEYNSKLPIIVYLPQDLEVKYRIWRADKQWQMKK